MSETQDNQGADEWSNVPSSEFTAEGDTSVQTSESSLVPAAPPKMTFDSAAELLMKYDTSSIRPEVKYNPPKGFLCFGPSVLDAAYQSDVIQFLSLAKVTVQQIEETQAMLFAFYTLMTGIEQCSPRGEHWEKLGFQGLDPRTDFRSCGIISLLQMFYFAAKEGELARKIYQLSQLPSTNFPFAVISINITSFVLESIRQGGVNKIINTYGNPFETLHQLYVATYYYLALIWKTGKKTIHDCSDVLNKVKTECVSVFYGVKLLPENVHTELVLPNKILHLTAACVEGTEEGKASLFFMLNKDKFPICHLSFPSHTVYRLNFFFTENEKIEMFVEGTLSIFITGYIEKKASFYPSFSPNVEVSGSESISEGSTNHSTGKFISNNSRLNHISKFEKVSKEKDKLSKNDEDGDVEDESFEESESESNHSNLKNDSLQFKPNISDKQEIERVTTRDEKDDDLLSQKNNNNNNLNSLEKLKKYDSKIMDLVECNICHKILTNKNGWKQHMRQKHGLNDDSLIEVKERSQPKKVEGKSPRADKHFKV